MKGIVLDKYNNEVAVLSEDGVVSKMKNNCYEIGQEITMKKTKSIRSKFITGVASFVATIAIFTIGGYAYYTPTDYVSLDVNPSIEYTLNMFDRVLDVKAINDDGEEILKSLYLDNHTIEEAVKLTLAELVDKGYLTDDEDGGVIVTTSNADSNIEEAEKMASDLKAQIQAFIDEHENITGEVVSFAVGKERVVEAKSLGVTPGKLNLVQKLQASTTGAINLEEYLEMSVKEINKTIKENSFEEKNRIREKNGDTDLTKSDSLEEIEVSIEEGEDLEDEDSDQKDFLKDDDDDQRNKGKGVDNKDIIQNKPTQDKDRVINENKPTKNNEKNKN